MHIKMCECPHGRKFVRGCINFFSAYSLDFFALLFEALALKVISAHGVCAYDDGANNYWRE